MDGGLWGGNHHPGIADTDRLPERVSRAWRDARRRGRVRLGFALGRSALFRYPIAEVVRPAGRAIVIGLSISIATGLLLFATRASMAVENGYFQLKMSLLFVATVCQILVYRRVTPVGAFAGSTRFIGMLGAAMYLGVVAAGSAFILLE